MSFLLLLTGSMIYILFRPTSLLMFRWFEFFQFFGSIRILRELFRDQPVPDWIVYNLPFGLWMFSGMILIESIWHGTKSKWSYFYLWVIPSIALGSEFLQYFRWIPGTFDSLDVIILSFGAFFFIRRIK
ncbi:hypothetical protein EHO98_22225 [Leptospira stimsonii]|nr:hypothetical protein EHO98_22225 [Leptospira stimsonii]